MVLHTYIIFVLYGLPIIVSILLSDCLLLFTTFKLLSVIIKSVVITAIIISFFRFVDCVGFGQLYFDTPISRCLHHNNLRSGDERIDESVILKMNDRLQIPNPAEHPWENHSLCLTNSRCDN